MRSETVLTIGTSAAVCAEGSPGRVCASSGGTGGLPGRYKRFFIEESHGEVRAWFERVATAEQRRHFKAVVKEALDFDAANARSKLAPTARVDVAGANAIVVQHGGDLLSEEGRRLASEYLSFAPPAIRQRFRLGIGLIRKPPGMVDRTAFREEFGKRSKRYMNSETTHLDTAAPILARSLLHEPSVPIAFTGEPVAPRRTTAGQSFVWKTAPKQGLNNTVSAHTSTYQSAPFGQYDQSSRERFQTAHMESFIPEHTYLGGAQATAGGLPLDPAQTRIGMRKRRFQNYNDNFARALNAEERASRKEKRLLAFATHRGLMTDPQVDAPLSESAHTMPRNGAVLKAMSGGVSGAAALMGVSMSPLRERPAIAAAMSQLPRREEEAAEAGAASMTGTRSFGSTAGAPSKATLGGGAKPLADPAPAPPMGRLQEDSIAAVALDIRNGRTAGVMDRRLLATLRETEHSHGGPRRLGGPGAMPFAASTAADHRVHGVLGVTSVRGANVDVHQPSFGATLPPSDAPYRMLSPIFCR